MGFWIPNNWLLRQQVARADFESQKDQQAESEPSAEGRPWWMGPLNWYGEQTQKGIEFAKNIWQDVPINPYYWKTPEEKAQLENEGRLTEWAQQQGYADPEAEAKRILTSGRSGPVTMGAYNPEQSGARMPATTIPESYNREPAPQRFVAEWLAPALIPGGFGFGSRGLPWVAERAATVAPKVLRQDVAKAAGQAAKGIKGIPQKGTIVPKEGTLITPDAINVAPEATTIAKKAMLTPEKPYRMKITTTRGGAPFTEEITVTPIGDKLVGRAPNPYLNTERLYAVYDKEGQVIKSGFDTHSEALDYAARPVSPIAEITPKIGTPARNIERPGIPVEPVQIAPTRATEPLIGGASSKPVEPPKPPPAATGAGGIEPPKPPVDITKNPDDFISDYAKYVNGEQSAMDWDAIQPIRSAERATKASDFLQEIESGVKQGLSPDEILRNAESRLAGKLSSGDTGIHVPPNKRQPFYAKLIDTVMNDASIPRGEKAFRIQSTKDALDSFLDGRPIPDIPGIKGGSAKTRLQYLFKDNPDMLKVLDKPAGEPIPLDPAILEYLRSLPDNGGQLSLLPVSSRMKAADFIRNKVGANIVDVLNIPRAVRASMDISFGGRQGSIAGTRHPVEWGKQFVRGLKAMRSEEVANKVNNELLRDPDVIYGLSQTKKLDVISLKKGAGYMERPEPFASRIADNIGIPGTGLKVRTFNRSFAVSSNSMQLGVFKQGVKALRKRGAGPKEYDELADFANWLVGRGALPGGLQQAAPYLNALLFSPKYMFARLRLPSKLLSSSPYVRQQAWQTLATFLGFGATVLTAGYLLTKEGTEYDPRSTEYGKFTIGKTRFDMWSGYVQWVRFLAQITTGQRKTSEGKIVSADRYNTAVRFAQSKDSPIMQILIDVLKGSDYSGEKLSEKAAYDYAKDYLLPFAVSDTLEALEQEDLPTAIGVGAAAVGGIGVVTYESKEQKGGGVDWGYLKNRPKSAKSEGGVDWGYLQKRGAK